MSSSLEIRAQALQAAFGDKIQTCEVAFNEITLDIKPENLSAVATDLRDKAEFAFVQLSDISGIDYSQYGVSEWVTDDSSATGFSRGVDASVTMGRLQFGDELEPVSESGKRFAAIYQLISYSHNSRLRLRVYAENDDFPVIPSVVEIWSSANWYEREAFDLFGILFSNHPDLRRILTDYGFVGHPFRKDFPLIGNVEMRYDPEKKRVIYQPVSIEPRVLVPKVIREDHRYIADDSSENEEEASPDA